MPNISCCPTPFIGQLLCSETCRAELLLILFSCLPSFHCRVNVEGFTRLGAEYLLILLSSEVSSKGTCHIPVFDLGCSTLKEIFTCAERIADVFLRRPLKTPLLHTAMCKVAPSLYYLPESLEAFLLPPSPFLSSCGGPVPHCSGIGSRRGESCSTLELAVVQNEEQLKPTQEEEFGEARAEHSPVFVRSRVDSSASLCLVLLHSIYYWM